MANPQTYPASVPGRLLPQWWLAADERPAPVRRFDANAVSLAEILEEPITQALMRADKVSSVELAALCDRLRYRLTPERRN